MEKLCTLISGCCSCIRSVSFINNSIFCKYEQILECRPFLQQQHRIELKRLLINQYSKLKSSFLYKKKEDEMVLTRKEKKNSSYSQPRYFYYYL